MNKPYSFNVDDEKDPDIVACLDAIAKGQMSAFIRDAIRCQMAKERDLSNREVVDTLLAALANLRVVTDQVESGESPELLHALSGLGEW